MTTPGSEELHGEFEELKIPLVVEMQLDSFRVVDGFTL